MEHIRQSHDILSEMEDDSMETVLVESPLSAPDARGVARNKKYARACMRDCLLRGEAPYASHLLFAQEGLLCDEIPFERALGMHAGLVWGKMAKKTVVYGDLGVSSGMERGIARALSEGRAVERRMLGAVPEPSDAEVALEEARILVERELWRKFEKDAGAGVAKKGRTP